MPSPDTTSPIGVIIGVGQSSTLRDLTPLVVPTPYGPTSGPLRTTEINGRRVVFIARRGEGEALQPHLVPYRANIWALASLGVRVLITSTASSGLNDAFPPGTFAVIDDVIDRTYGRDTTFFDHGAAVQLAAPELFDATLRGLTVEALTAQQVRVRDFGTSVVVNGPRFSSPAEGRWHAAIGGDIANMTVMPETCLAVELGMAVANVSFVADQGTGTASDHSDATNLDLVQRRSAQAGSTLLKALTHLVESIPKDFHRAPVVPQHRIDEVLALRPVGA